MEIPQFFDLVHVYLGQLAMILVVLLACMVWLRYTAAAVRMSDSLFSFPARFLGWSSALLLVWLFVYEDYVLVHLHGIRALLDIFGYQYSVATEKINPTSFNTLNMVTYAGLVLATRSVKNKKVRRMILGVAVLLISHFFFGLTRVLYLGFGEQIAFWPFFAFVAINELVLPFGLWLTVVGKEIFVSMGIYTCPLCGKPVKGLYQHVTAKHGRTALKDKRVQTVLDRIETEKMAPGSQIIPTT